ncbi:sialate O-acetylesterase [Pelagicoccus mobilis]|uniref:Sialate O-acetylesterase domain-containing protein n=1 Tax=Pelagicoccus mobilis TaxID=415221 RepID=A0A934S228_9BACT|nr:sialate O-acetylesterase [Pelagicoccus mobilis]MBK1879644.1 hypothetical protein [Pelagicoccus mobilis]
MNLKLKGVLFALLLMPIAAGFAEASKGKLKTYLLLGQSNMAGWGDYSSLDSEWTKSLEESDRIHFCGKETRWEVSGLSPSRRAVEKPYKVNGTFGPEYSFIDSVSQAYSEEELLFFKYAVGGTTLYAAWEKEWTREKAEQVKETREIKHRLYALMLEKIEALEVFAQQKGYQGVDIQAVAWVQGESDAGREFSAQAYKKNLKKFIGNLRRDLPDSEFKFVYLQVNNMKSRFIEEVRRSQEELAVEMDNVFVIPSSTVEQPDDFPKYDQVHYNSEGVLNIGKSLAVHVLK